MPKTIKDSISEIKKLEEKLMDNEEDSASAKKLGAAFKSLKKIKDGPLAYLDITTMEDIMQLYKVSADEQFDQLQMKDKELKGASNPNNYAWIHSDIHLVVIEKTPHNEEIAGAVINDIIAALKERN